MKPLRIGLVLTGGGARAAYQVGVLRAISALPLEVVAISAVGAGALNGAVLAGAQTTATAAATLAQLWQETVLAEESALRLGPLPVLRLGTYLTLLFAGGVSPEVDERLRGVAGHARNAWVGNALKVSAPSDLTIAAISMAIDQLNVSTDAELNNYLSGSFREAASQPRLPFFVSVYETGGHILETAKHGLQLLGLLDAGSPRYLEVSSPDLSADERIGAVLASASLPFVCKPTQVAGRQFIDGSFAGMKRSPGAVPLQPFRRRQDALLLDAVVVIHTEGGVSWDANQFGDTTIIEIRPSSDSEENGIGYFWPEKARLGSWIDLGERDGMATLASALREVDGWRRSTDARRLLRKAVEDAED